VPLSEPTGTSQWPSLAQQGYPSQFGSIRRANSCQLRKSLTSFIENDQLGFDGFHQHFVIVFK